MASVHSFWSDERVELLKQLWPDKSMTGEMIAARIGAPSRAAVLAKAARLGLEQRGTPLGCRVAKTRWTDEIEARLKELWFLDVTRVEIAALLGSGHTVKAIENKASKLGLPRRTTFRSRHGLYAGRAKARRKNPAAPRKPRLGAVRPQGWAGPEEAPRVPSVPAPSPLLMTLLELGPRDCRYAVGDVGKPDFGFCGHGTAHGSAYCQYHYELCGGEYGEETGADVVVEKPKRRFQEKAEHFMRWRIRQGFEFREAA